MNPIFRLSLVAGLSLYALCATAQKHDNVWIKVSHHFDTHIGPFPANVFLFEQSPPIVTSEMVNFYNDGTIMTMCDSVGLPIFFSNGQQVFHMDGTLMENGDSINWNDWMDVFKFGLPRVCLKNTFSVRYG